MDTKDRLNRMLEGLEKEKQDYRKDMGKYPEKVFLHPFTIEKLEEEVKYFQTEYHMGKLNDMKIVADDSREPFEYGVG